MIRESKVLAVRYICVYLQGYYQQALLIEAIGDKMNKCKLY